MMKYIKYSLLLKEPLRVADDSSAKQGQTMTRRYIPGSTMRGFMINRLSSAAFFPSIKRELFSDFVRFHNAYLSIETEGTEQILLPSPKGFYEELPKLIKTLKKRGYNFVTPNQMTGLNLAR